jgi:hypothetical protein
LRRTLARRPLPISGRSWRTCWYGRRINSPTDWINLHVNVKNKNPSDTSSENNGGKPWVIGWPFKTVDKMLNRISWVESTADFFNVWVCMSQQGEHTTKKGDPTKLRAVRNAANATWLRPSGLTVMSNRGPEALQHRAGRHQRARCVP